MTEQQPPQGMNMGRFGEKHDQVVTNSGSEFADIPKLVVQQGQVVRLVGDFESNWEHFVTMAAGKRPYYCDGPESDCPICKQAMAMATSDDANQQEVAKNVRAKEKFYFNTLDRSANGKQWHSTSKKSYVLAQNAKGLCIGSQLFQAIGSVVKMRDQQGQSSDPNTFDIMLTKEGAGMQTKYGAQFTGQTDELTDVELAYELWNLKQITKITPHAERQAVADYLADASLSAPVIQPQQAVAPQQMAVAQPQQAVAPQQMAVAPQQMAVAPQQIAPPAAQPPQAQGAIKVVGQVQKQPAQVATITPSQPVAAAAVDDTYQDATPGRAVDMGSHMQVPCDNCGGELLFSMEDTRNFKCSSCGLEYAHPNAEPPF